MRLCLLDLAQLTGGRLRLAAMPRRDGELALAGRIVLAAEDASEGDLFWCLDRHKCDAELAFLRGALAVVIGGRPIEPWPGRACLHVDDPTAALRRLITEIRGSGTKVLSTNAELKVLQLCAEPRCCISPPTRSECRMSKIKCRMNDE